MGKKRARHSKGNNKSDGKRQRADREEKWKATRGDDNSGHNTAPVNAKYDTYALISVIILTFSKV